MNEMKQEKIEGAPIEAPDDVAGSSEAIVTSSPARRSFIRLALMLVVPLLLLAGGVYYYISGGDTVSTDNASVKQDIVSVGSQVNGPVVEVAVKNGAEVKRGQLLVRIDAEPYRVALEQAQAQLAAAHLQTTQLRTQAAGTGADITGAQANLAIKQNALGRQQALLKQGFTTRTNYEDALNEVRAAETQLADARARAANANAAIAPGEQPSIAQAQAAVDKAQLDLSRTEVRAPMDGTVANADRLQVGQMSVQGVGMLSIVHNEQAWVEANFKEKDVGKMVRGQRATIEIDAYPGATSRAISRASAQGRAASSPSSPRRTRTAIGSR